MAISRVNLHVAIVPWKIEKPDTIIVAWMTDLMLVEFRLGQLCFDGRNDAVNITFHALILPAQQKALPE